MSATNFTIKGNTYESWATVQEADIRLAVRLGMADPWDALTDEQKQIRLVFASEEINSLGTIAGKKVNANQRLQLPATELECDGVATTDTLPLVFEEAVIDLAGRTAQTPSVVTTAGQATRVIEEFKALVTGVEIRYATGATQTEDAPTLFDLEPQILRQVACYFVRQESTVTGSSVGFGSGAEDDSMFDCPDPFGLFNNIRYRGRYYYG